MFKILLCIIFNIIYIILIYYYNFNYLFIGIIFIIRFYYFNWHFAIIISTKKLNGELIINLISYLAIYVYN